MKENVSFKVPEINLEGEYTIQLFDENGKLVKEEKKHNCINKAIFSTAYWNNILCGIIDNDSKRTDCYGNENTGINVGHVNWLMLTSDSEAPENDYKNPVVMGEMIGYAHSSDTKSYADVKRGLINVNETTKINNYVDGSDKKIKSITKHLVWDFATDKGNGEFDNVYLTGLPLNYSSASYNPNNYRGCFTKHSDFLLNSKSTENIYATDCGPFSHDAENLYVQCLFLANTSKNNTAAQSMCYDTVAKISQDTWSVEYITLQVPSANSNNAAYIIQAGGYFWRIEYNFNCTKYRINGEYVSTFNLSSQFSNTFLNIGMSVNNLSHNSEYDYKYNFDSFTGDDKYLYIGYKTSDYKRYICVFNANGTKVSENFVGDSIIQNNRVHQCCLNMLYINNRKVLLSSSYKDISNLFYVDENGSLTQISNDNLKFLSEGINGGNVNISINYVFYSKNGDLFSLPYKDRYNYGSIIEVGHFIPWTSHVKLDSPITKTSANTMKIQYDITCEYVPVGGIENIE